MNFEQLAYVKTVYEMESMIHASEKCILANLR